MVPIERASALSVPVPRLREHRLRIAAAPPMRAAPPTTVLQLQLPIHLEQEREPPNPPFERRKPAPLQLVEKQFPLPMRLPEPKQLFVTPQ